EGEKFLIKYYLKDESTGKSLSKFGGFARGISAAVNPVLGQIDISELPTGNFLLVVEAINSKGELVIKHENFFYRRNKNFEVLAGSFEDRSISGSWVDMIGNLDSIVKFVDFLYPISSEGEQALQESLLQEGNESKLKKYFYAFWQERKPLAPQEAWQAYHREVRIANKLFSSGLSQGYKSDRGRVYLMYGKPSLEERRDMEPNMPPYIIWQYDNITTNYTVPQNNRIFIFGEFEPSTRIYKLIHSTAIGEINSPDWKQELYFRAYGGPGTIDPGNDPNQREFGSRANQNIIMGTTGADRRNR
ncbi:MAG: GWxTD domain-containing protein, partial [Croceimicrobium sp.]